MIKRYCDRCGQQIDEGVHAWYVLELHGTDGEFRHKELCEECYEYLCEKDEAPKADRKTEPQKKEVEWVYNKRERLWYPYSNGELLFKEIPNNCEHITDDGVTCAKYPACDDCLDNPLNKVKGSERLLKGKDEPQTDGYMTAEQTEDYRKMLDKAEHKVYGNIEDEPQTCSVNGRPYDCGNCEYFKCTADEPQAEVIMPKKCKGCDSASKIIEAYSRGFKDGAEAVEDEPKYDAEEVAKDINRRVEMGKKEVERQTDCAWK